jgi:Asp-tRNA(Asn)/Glu-tRNA(Gln) amidotransferase A subunit family amidase
MDTPARSRRDFIAHSLALGGAALPLAATAALVPAASPAAGEAQKPQAAATLAPNAITPKTIEEAEKLHAVRFTAAQRVALAAAAPVQVAGIESLRKIERPLWLRPALNFDPRLPGRRYPSQKNSLRLAPAESSALPADDAAIAFAPVAQLSGWIRSKQLTSARLTQIYLERIERIAPRLFCYITVCADAARARAKAMDAEIGAGRYRGALHGIPYSLKDVFDTAGIATTWGSALYRNHIPSENAAIVGTLDDAGAVLLGKVAMGELANGWEWFGGKVRNPWNPAEPAGGSSSGSGSSVAAALCAFSIGSDSLGSILNPSDRCGVVGLRPTFGRVPVKGAMPLTPSLERIGPICRGVEDAALVLAVINGPDASSASSVDVGFGYDAQLDITKLRVGYSPQWFEGIGFDGQHTASGASAELKALDALRGLGVTLVQVKLPKVEIGSLIDICYVEAATVFEPLTLSGEDEKLTTQAWPPDWRRARLISAVDYLQIERYRRQVMEQMQQLFETVDVLFGPTYGSPDLLLTTNFTGHPGLTLRAGLIESPTRSMQVERFFMSDDPNGAKHTITRNVAFHGRLYEEGKMLALARRLEQALGVAHHRPDIARG